MFNSTGVGEIAGVDASRSCVVIGLGLGLGVAVGVAVDTVDVSFWARMTGHRTRRRRRRGEEGDESSSDRTISSLQREEKYML